jgi:hypothetical protein
MALVERAGCVKSTRTAGGGADVTANQLTERQVLFDIFDVSIGNQTCAPESTLALRTLLLKNVALALFTT